MQAISPGNSINSVARQKVDIIKPSFLALRALQNQAELFKVIIGTRVTYGWQARRRIEYLCAGIPPPEP